jgi:hypothetical protein
VRLLALLTILILSDVPPAPNAVEIISAGEHHGAEVPANTPGVWFALVADDAGASLRRVRVSVATVKDEIVDEGAEMTGKRVDVSPAVEPIALVRGVRGLRPGRVPTALVKRTVDQSGVSTRLGGRAYHLSMRCAERSPVEGQRQEDCDLILRFGKIEQVLFTYLAYYEGNNRVWASERQPEVLWAGDVDADGKLDLLLETSNHYNVAEMRLFLSRGASPSALVQELAAHSTTGC